MDKVGSQVGEQVRPLVVAPHPAVEGDLLEPRPGLEQQEVVRMAVGASVAAARASLASLVVEEPEGRVHLPAAGQVTGARELLVESD